MNPEKGSYTYQDYLQIPDEPGYRFEILDDTLEAYALRGENYALVALGCPGDRFAHSDFPGLDLDLDRVFHRPPVDEEAPS